MRRAGGIALPCAGGRERDRRGGGTGSSDRGRDGDGAGVRLRCRIVGGGVCESPRRCGVQTRAESVSLSERMSGHFRSHSSTAEFWSRSAACLRTCLVTTFSTMPCGRTPWGVSRWKKCFVPALLVCGLTFQRPLLLEFERRVAHGLADRQK